MKKLYILLAIIFTATATFSQPCLPEGITFSTQQQIDDFQTNYLNCTEIEGDVQIEGYDITNLLGLENLTFVRGDLRIYDNQGLTNLTGLNSLESVGGEFHLHSNNSLTSLSGLEELKYIGGEFWFFGNTELSNFSGLDNLNFMGSLYLLITHLTSLSGLNNVNTIGGDCIIGLNENISSLSGLDNLTSVGGNLKMYGNAHLTDLSGLQNLTHISGSLNIGHLWYTQGSPSIIGNALLTRLPEFTSLDSIGGNLYIMGNEMLMDINGLSNLSSVGGDIVFYDNAILNNLSGLSNVNSVGGMLDIGHPDHGGNPALTSLSGLENIQAEFINSLYIRYNYSLSQCEVESICEYLAHPTGTIEIHDNAPGCNSPEKVLEACAVGIPEIHPESFTIYPNPATKELFISSNHEIIIDEVNIYNQLGQNVLHQQKFNHAIDVSMLQPGIYILELVVGESLIREKLIIEY